MAQFRSRPIYVIMDMDPGGDAGPQSQMEGHVSMRKLATLACAALLAALAPAAAYDDICGCYGESDLNPAVLVVSSGTGQGITVAWNESCNPNVRGKIRVSWTAECNKRKWLGWADDWVACSGTSEKELISWYNGQNGWVLSQVGYANRRNLAIASVELLACDNDGCGGSTCEGNPNCELCEWDLTPE